MKARALLFLLLAVGATAAAQLVIYARDQNERADNWREEYFALLDSVDK